tara:strand:- start:268 stop:750 length:483 start_codon:yes stop_codon:yes gene_type:complete
MQILISSCVLGNNVRWNGSNRGYKDIELWAESNGFELIPVCPEHAIFGTPRPPIKLHKVADQIMAMMKGQNIYPELVDECKSILKSYPDAVGFVGIAGSPTCGISVGVAGAGKVMKAPMHAETEFPTTEINTLRSEKGRDLFKKRIEKWVNSRVKSDCGS